MDPVQARCTNIQNADTQSLLFTALHFTLSPSQYFGPNIVKFHSGSLFIFWSPSISQSGHTCGEAIV